MGRSKVGPLLRACSSVACFPVKNRCCPCSLEENDKIKSEINPRKINEPKTPYHGPMEEEPGCGEIGLHTYWFRTAPLVYTRSLPNTDLGICRLCNISCFAGEPGMSPLTLEAEVNTALNSAYRQVSQCCCYCPVAKDLS